MRKICLLFLLLFSCQAHLNEHETQALDIKVDEIPDDIRIPTKIWNEIQGSEPSITKSIEADDLGLNKGMVLFSPVTVVLKEHNPNVLTSQEVRIALPRGGGKVDLANFMGREPGSFFIRFEWPEWKDLTGFRSFYVSRGRKRKLDGEVYGSGCNRFMEISSRIAKDNSHEGIKVNSTRERHTTVLAGHFVFSAKKDSQIYLTQVTFVDSKNMNLICEDSKSL